MEIIGYISALFVGLIIGLTGGGGSILSLPILVYFFGIDAIAATAYSLFIVGVASTVGTIKNLQRKMVNIRTGIIFSIPSLLAIFLTRRFLVPAIPKTILETDSLLITDRLFIMTLFAIVMIFASISLIRAGRKKEKNEVGDINVFKVILEGTVVGVVTGIVGAGGGFLIVTVLTVMTGLPMRIAVGTTLLIVSAKSLVGFSGDLLANQPIDWNFLLTFTGITIIGLVLGLFLINRIDAEKIKISFGWFVMGMAIIIFLTEIN